MPPLIAGRYESGEKIGSGGMGDVYRSLDTQTGKIVAIKALRQDQSSPDMIARFTREGEALRQLNHPSIVAMLDAVEENDMHYLVMEYIDGGALNTLMEKNGKIPLKQLAEIGLDLADALTRAHRLNIIHRDIKPANVLLAKDGTPRLTDFGIARVGSSSVTETGVVLGTIAYLAPEILQGGVVDARSDVWALGVMFYEMLTGKHPFAGENVGTMIFDIAMKPVPDLEKVAPDTPAALIDLINRMLAKNPEERLPRMRLVGVELESLLAEITSGNVTTSAMKAASAPATESKPTRFSTSSPGALKIVRNNLPVQTTPFVGRETEMQEVEKLLSDANVRMVTIMAPGGMGKTRLSLETAARFVTGALTTLHRDLFDQGIYLVDLAPLNSADNIVPAVAEATGYTFQQDGRPPAQQLVNFLQEKHMLLVMDNFEHVTAGRTLVQDILQGAPHVKILVTSREKLNLSAESVFILSGMEFPAWETASNALEYGAVKLFMQSARRVQPGFALQSDDLKHIARICHLVRGTPLGILLAAGWLEALSLREIADEISRSLDFLETEMHDLPERQRSVRAVFEYSWALLAESERALLAQLSIFRGGFTREAAQEITNASLRTLTILVNKSLLRRDILTGRYEIHELVRQYAEEKLRESGTTLAIFSAHSRYYTRLPQTLTPRLKGNGQLEALTQIEDDFENIRTAWNRAVDMGDNDAVSTALEGLYLFLTYRSRMMEGEQLFRAARQVFSADGPTPSLLAGQLLVRFPDSPPLEKFRRGLEIAKQHNNPAEIAFCNRLVGHWLSHTEFNQAEGIPLLEESLKLYESLHDDYRAAAVMDDLGWSYNLNGQPERQTGVIARSLELRRALGDKIGIANSLRNLGGALGGFYNTDGRSIAHWQEAKDIAYEMNDRLGVAWNASLQAANFLFLGDLETTIDRLDEAYPYAVDVNDGTVRGFILLIRACVLALGEEKYLEAQKLIREGYPPGTGLEFRTMIAPFAISLVASGLKQFDEMIELNRQVDETDFFGRLRDLLLALGLPQFVVMIAHAGQYERAAELMGLFSRANQMHSVRFRAEMTMPLAWADHWPLLTRLRADLEAKLGKAAYQAAYDRIQVRADSSLSEILKDDIARYG